jgi:hypothetical protein
MASNPVSAARQALEALLRDALADPSVASGYAIRSIAFGETAEVSLEKGGATFVLWVRSTADEGPFYAKTRHFKIGHRGDPPDQLGYAVIDAVRARIEAWEGALSASERASLFAPRAARHVRPYWGLEWLAVRAGLKPACRILVASGDAERLLAYARADGLQVCVTEADRFVSGFCAIGLAEHTTLVHAAPSEEVATATAGIERSMIEACGRGERVTADQVRALGAALGYPPCCIAAFVEVRDLSNAEIRFRALRRTPGRAPRLLNNVVEERALVSHCLCRYDCPASLRYAEALFQELSRLDPATAAELERGLGGLVALFRSGGVLRLLATAGPTEGTYRFAALEASGGGAGLEHWRAALGDADAVDVCGGDVRVLRGGAETCRLAAPPDDVQIRLFV